MTLYSSVQACVYLYYISIYCWFEVLQFCLISVLTNCVSDRQIF